ncbi:MAG: hypothetical protein GY798_34470 [Hyphomicrobiales bacterium]|nr:hypothetical protein [Hyphomicrobiales bacterium]
MEHATNNPALQDAVAWLLDGDVAIQYQTRRDLSGTDRPDLRARIASEGWGKRTLDHRNPDGSWGLEFYRPKWTSSHYTLLDLKALAIAPDHPPIRDSIATIVAEFKAKDGGIGCSRGAVRSDVCVNGMFLNYASYFGTPEAALRSIVDFLLDEHMGDGGFNCRSNGSGAHHSSLHSTLSVLEGILEYANAGHTYRLAELQDATTRSRDFILLHRLFRSDRTGEVIDKRFLTLSYPPRWYYNILRALDYFRHAQALFDPRMQDAIDALLARRRKDGLWPRQAAHPGQVFFVMEPSRRPSRWNTLMALRVLKAFGV